ncbi:DUF4397 domain-containing protein [Carboxylicivirga sediminis]|uniref:DUF4397 domain-containing protein n=1 Tax=Carboxylicivirga sediminis TaxID=2006564 RepID=A0A941F5D6_9BACT|nr:DUF4397 domain-containing protein [Carboxylicivirga sediminis]MBR8536687.1 DUF4397 domain-containing protein [Carboxylicivirga sediminis]
MRTFLIGMLLGLFIVSCGSDSTSDPKPEPEMEEAKLTTYNYLPVDFAIDWHVNDEERKANQAYAFGNGITIEWPKDNNSIKLEVLNASDKTSVVADNELFDDGQEYIAMVFGTAAVPELKVLENDLTPPVSGKVRVRFFHALHGVGAVDIYVGGEAASYKKVSNLAYKSASEYMDLVLGEMSGQVVYTPTGVLPNEQTDVLRYSDNQNSEADKIYTHVLAPKIDDFSKAGVFMLNH